MNLTKKFKEIEIRNREKEMTELKALSNKSLMHKLTESEYQKMMKLRDKLIYNEVRK